MQEEEKAKKFYVEAVEKAKAELDENPSIQGKKAFDELRSEHFNFLNKLKHAALTQEKGKLVNYLFEKALSRLSSLEVSNKPSLFLVYAHENKAHGKAEAGTSKYLIEKLSQIQIVLYSDQTPIAQPYSSALGEVKKDSKLEDILTNQLCLLPGQLHSDVEPVDKVVVCCSEVLGSYLKWSEYDNFYQKLREAYGKDREAYLKGGEQGNAWAIREVVREFSQEEKYKAGFHHVLTEMAFLQVRAEQLKDGHGIIPVPITRNSYDDCLSRFISATTVRMEDIPRFEAQVQAGGEVYPNQSRHWVLFKLIERLLASSDEAKTFLDKFWQGYSDCTSRLKGESTFDGFEFIKRVDGIFDEIERSLHKQLASTVQQVYPAWQQVDTRLLDQSRDLAQLQTGVDSLVARLLGNLQENIQKLRTTYLEGLQQDREIKDAMANYVSLEGMLLHDSTRFDLESKVQDFLSSDKKVLLLLGEAGSGKSTFNRQLALNLWQKYIQTNAVRGSPIPVFIQLSSLPESNRNLVEAFFETQGFSKEQIKELQTRYRFVLILDGFDEIKNRERAFYKDNHLDDWQGAKIIVSSRPEYLGSNYQYKFYPSGERSALQEYRLAPFSEKTIERYVDQYKKAHPGESWSAGQYKEALKQRDLKELVGNPFLLKITLSVLPELSRKLRAEGQRFTRIGLYDEFVNNWFERSQQRLAQIQLNPEEAKEFRRLEQTRFVERGMGFSKKLALEMHRAGEVVSTYLATADDPWEEPSAELSQAWRKRLLGNDNAMTVLMRLNAPLICQGDQYRFIHKSLQDYFVARALWEELRGSAKSHDEEHSKKLNAIRSVRAVWEGLGDRFEFEPSVQFNALNVVEDPAAQSFLVERVQEDRVFLKALLAWVKASKGRDDVKRGASNALTVLVKAGLQFNGCDLRGIQVPGADLSYGVFDSAQLQGSDLRSANLRAIWLREANLSGVQMSGVQFGEWPYLQEESEVNSCAYSPDGNTCVMGLDNGKISLYRTSDLEKIHTLEGHKDCVNSVVYSPSGAELASGSRDSTVRVWDVESGALRHTLNGHEGSVRSVVYSPSGAELASGSGDRTIRVWDVKSGALCHTLEGHKGSVRSVVYSPSGAELASGSEDSTIRVWNIESGELRHTIKRHGSWVNSVVYSPSGAELAEGGEDSTIRVWDVESGALRHTLKGHLNSISSVAYSPSGTELASGSKDNTVRLWDMEIGGLRHTLEGHENWVKSVVYSPSGAQLASGSLDSTVRVWDVERGGPRYTLLRHKVWVKSVVYSPNGAELALGSEDSTVRVWDVESGALYHTLLGHKGWVNSVVYSPSGAELASGSEDSTVRVWDVESGGLRHTLEGHKNAVHSVVYSPSGSQIASGSYDRTVRVWDVESGALRYTLEGHEGLVNSIVYSPSGAELASGGWGGKVRVWDVESGWLRHTLEGHRGWVSSVAYSPTVAQLASAGEDRTVRVWDVESGALRHTLEGHEDSVYSVVYSPTVAQLASGSGDRTVRVWDMESGALRYTLEGHKGLVRSVVYSPNGAQLVSGSNDNTVRLWEVESGDCLMVIQEFKGVVNSVAWKWRQNVVYLLSGNTDNSARVWEVKNDGREHKAMLCWSSVHGVLTARDTLLEGVVGLSEMNQRLLKQRGAALA